MSDLTLSFTFFKAAPDVPLRDDELDFLRREVCTIMQQAGFGDIVEKEDGRLCNQDIDTEDDVYFANGRQELFICYYWSTLMENVENFNILPDYERIAKIPAGIARLSNRLQAEPIGGTIRMVARIIWT